ncbi:unnamed protein product [Echinostoma caproni]|uniref:Calponin-homology (CH) domain-containing protein n=1 Tax=Echinostoma caproni TaxID=27848 RepID=A0A183ARM1_9TREM|nr:unnamed protein product [Echinostoma caproni]
MFTRLLCACGFEECSLVVEARCFCAWLDDLFILVTYYLVRDITGITYQLQWMNTQLRALATQSGQDLLLWCQQVTKDYPNVKITDLTSSFRSGLAFCAILHHFFPDQLDFSQLSNNSPIENCRLAFNVAAKLGIPRVLDPGEVTSANRAPDLLSMMTYLHQLRTHCCGRSPGLTDPSVVDSVPTQRINSINPVDGSNTKSSQESQSAESPASTQQPNSNHVPQTRSPSKTIENTETAKLDAKARPSTEEDNTDAKPTNASTQKVS